MWWVTKLAVLDDILQTGLRELGLKASKEQQQQMLDYVALLKKWNNAYNLTAIRDEKSMVRRHLLDSLSVLPWLGTETTLDVGTGAGLPGIVLAIMRPDQAFILLDSNGKKTRFVRQAVLELGLPNVEVVQSRVQDFHRQVPQITARAFASLPDMLAMMAHILPENGSLLAMKAAQAELEIAQAPEGWHFDTVELHVPGLNEHRELVIAHSAK